MFSAGSAGFTSTASPHGFLGHFINRHRGRFGRAQSSAILARLECAEQASHVPDWRLSAEPLQFIGDWFAANKLLSEVNAMPFLKGRVEIEFYKGHPLRQGELLAPWVRERHTDHTALYGDSQHTIQMTTEIEKDHLDQLFEFVDFGKAIKSLGERIAELAGAPEPRGALMAALAARGAYDEFRGFLNTFTARRASGWKVLNVAYPDSRFDCLLLRFSAYSEEDDLPAFAVGPTVEHYLHHLAHDQQPAVTFGRPQRHQPEDGGGRHRDSPGGMEWDRFRQTEFILDFRRLAASCGDRMYEDIAFTQSFGMSSSWGDLGVEQAFLVKVVRPAPPVLRWFEPVSASPGEVVRIDGTNLLGAEVMFGNLPAPSVRYETGSLVATVPEVPPLVRSEIGDPIVVRTPGGSTLPSPGRFSIVRRLAQLRCPQQEAGQMLQAGQLVEVEGVHLTGVKDVQWVGGRGLFGETGPDTGKEFPASWRLLIENADDGEGFLKRERLFVAVPHGLPAICDLFLTTLGQTVSLGSFFMVAPPSIASVEQVGSKRALTIHGKGFGQLEKVYFGELEAHVNSVTDTFIRVGVSGTLARGHVVVHTAIGTAASSIFAFAAEP
jgi:hypothetical protein